MDGSRARWASGTSVPAAPLRGPSRAETCAGDGTFGTFAGDPLQVRKGEAHRNPVRPRCMLARLSPRTRDAHRSAVGRPHRQAANGGASLVPCGGAASTCTQGTPRLVAWIPNGSGLRLLDCARLKVQDVAFQLGQVSSAALRPRNPSLAERTRSPSGAVPGAGPAERNRPPEWQPCKFAEKSPAPRFALAVLVGLLPSCPAWLGRSADVQVGRPAHDDRRRSLRTWVSRARTSSAIHVSWARQPSPNWMAPQDPDINTLLFTQSIPMGKPSTAAPNPEPACVRRPSARDRDALAATPTLACAFSLVSDAPNHRNPPRN